MPDSLSTLLLLSLGCRKKIAQYPTALPGSQVHDLVGIRDLAPGASVRRDRLTPLNDGIDTLLFIAKAARFPERRRNLTEVFLPFGCQLVRLTGCGGVVPRKASNIP